LKLGLNKEQQPVSDENLRYEEVKMKLDELHKETDDVIR
jgi:hypothetical protein